MARIVTIEISDEQEGEASKLRAAWPHYSEAGFWAAVLAYGLDTVAALQHGEAVEDAAAKGPWEPVKPTSGDDIPF